MAKTQKQKQKQKHYYNNNMNFDVLQLDTLPMGYKHYHMNYN